MLTFTNSLRLTAAAFAATALCGCEAREMGVNFADQQAKSVDNSWVTAINTCWPDVAHQGYSLEGMKRYLADPLHFRAAFSTYAALNDSELRTVVTRPVMAAPPPDSSLLSHSQTAVFTRSQAISGVNQQNASATDNTTAAPTDALCAIHSGTPVGFR